MPSPTGRRLEALTLLQARPGITAAELATRLEVDERTARRDVAHLRDLGYRIDAEPGRHGGYRLASGSRLPPLVLDADEALAVALGLRASSGVRGLELAAATALAKLTGSVPERQRARIDAVAATGAADGAARRAAEPEAFVTLALACRAHEAVRFRHRAGGSATERVHEVQPLRLVLAAGRWYLIAVRRHEDRWRVWAVDRIGRVQPLGTRWDAPPPPDDVEGLVTGTLAHGSRRHHVVLRVHTSGDLVRSLVGPTTATVEDEDADTCVVRLRTDDLDWAARWVVHRDLDVDVVEPVALEERLHALGRWLAERYGAGGTPE